VTTYITPFQNELEIKDTTDTQKSASYLDLHLEIDNEAILKQNSTTNMMTSDFRTGQIIIGANFLVWGQLLTIRIIFLLNRAKGPNEHFPSHVH
jgi:hypothetical protein